MDVTIPENLLFTKNHEWARIEGDIAIIGITDFAQSQLGDIVYLELPEEDDEVSKDDPLGTVESTKAVSDVYTPLSGTIIEVNGPLVDSPEVINEDPYDEGWMVKIQLSNPEEARDLLNAADYRDFCESDEA